MLSVKPTVLIVEDELLLACNLEMTAEDFGLSADIATNLHDALTCLEKNSYALVITDFNFPAVSGGKAALNGVGVIRWLQTHSPHTPYRIYSGSGMASLKNALLEAGLNVDDSLFVDKVGGIDHVFASFQPA